ncbi:MAG: hypothetical protein SGI72_14600 [Planctomycetota bacterium]|nr:hypothetical protein [Planctomycetota bacterium]
MKQCNRLSHRFARVVASRVATVTVGSSLLAIAASITGCGGSGGSTSTPPPTLPVFSAANFANPAVVDNPLWNFPLNTSTTFATAGGSDLETIVVERLSGTRIVMGLDCIRVRDRVYSDGLLIEDTEDWYAQDDAGNVWYMGEAVIDYQYDANGVVIGTTTDGSWEAGLDPLATGAVARPGHAMRAQPAVGDYYYQEFYAGEAEDIGRVVALNVPVVLADGSAYACVQVQETSSIEPTANEFKYFAPGVGVVRGEKVGTSESVEFRGRFVVSAISQPLFSAGNFTTPSAIDHPHFPSQAGISRVFSSDETDGHETTVVERLPGTRIVMGIACARVRDRVYAGGLLLEDTEDWFAEDDAGNVWYMGEEVDNYAYDADGMLIGVDHDGSWEAGLDVAGTGMTALPGHQLPASLTPGTSYYQEFYPGAAEDMGLIVATGVALDLPDGTHLTNCLQTLDWNPLDPEGLEYKFYAPGIGLVREEGLHDSANASLVGSFDRSSASIPNFAGATFMMSTLINHPLHPLPAGASWEYEEETRDGLETVEIEVLPSTRVVMGVTCVAVRDRVRLDGVIVEDTEDWFAQDDAGNVWYFGESVVNYEYDDNGVLLGTNTAGSWEAGLDVDAVGSIAQPGIAMWAQPAVGVTYYQEFYATAAEDMGQIVAIGVTLTTPGGVTYAGCLQTLDWNPLDPDGLEYKYYAPAIGLVYERKLHEDAFLELTDSSL